MLAVAGQAQVGGLGPGDEGATGEQEGDAFGMMQGEALRDEFTQKQ